MPFKTIFSSNRQLSFSIPYEISLILWNWSIDPMDWVISSFHCNFWSTLIEWSFLQKKVLAITAPATTDTETLNHYYYRRAITEETLGNTPGAIENLKKVVNTYPSNQTDLAIEELFTYSLRESDAGNFVSANQALERARTKVTPNLRGWYLTIDKNIGLNCTVMGDFQCAQDRLSNRHELDYKLSRPFPHFSSVLIWMERSLWICG